MTIALVTSCHSFQYYFTPSFTLILQGMGFTQSTGVILRNFIMERLSSFLYHGALLSPGVEPYTAPF